MASPPLSQIPPWDFVGSLDSSWHGQTRLDSSNNTLIQANVSITTTPWHSLSGNLVGLTILDPTSTQTTVISGGEATPTPGWED